MLTDFYYTCIEGATNGRTFVSGEHVEAREPAREQGARLWRHIVHVQPALTPL